MKLLLDTHIFLWYIGSDPRLPAEIGDAIRDPANDIYVSVVVIWEAVIKHAIGKLPLPTPSADYLTGLRDRHLMIPLPLDDGAMPHLAALPQLHRDPFDRVLVAQAFQHGLTLVTVDAAVRAYAVPVLPAR